MSGDLSGFSMFELFQGEVESHTSALNEGLLALEADASDLSQAEKVMRAAHSVKGAARIIGLDPVVELAHAMEDCLVAVQDGKEQLTSSRTDQLLRGVDILASLTELEEKQLPVWMSEHEPACAQLSNDLRSAVEQSPAESPTPPDEAAKPADAPPPKEQTVEPEPPAKVVVAKEPEPAAAAQEPPTPTPENPTAPVGPPQPSPARDQRVVPVSASNLNRIMRLASESMIESRRLQSLNSSLREARDQLRNVTALADSLETGGAANEAVAEQLRKRSRLAEQLLQGHAGKLEQALWSTERTATALYHQAIGSRMRPFSEGTVSFPRLVRDLARSLGKQVSFDIEGASVTVDRDILRKLEAPLTHLLRNCIDHGIEKADQRKAAGKSETGHILLRARHHAGMLTVTVSDDGRGIDADSVKQKAVDRKLVPSAMADQLSHEEIFDFLFLPGFSTASRVTEVSGRGVGLDVVRSMVQEVSGTVRVTSLFGQSTEFTLRLPVTLSVIRAALAEIAGEPYAFPLSKLTRIVRTPRENIRSVQGRQQFLMDGKSIGLVSAAEILGFPEDALSAEEISIIVMGQDKDLFGLTVSQFIGEQDLVVRPLDQRLGKVPHISAAAITESGDALFIVDIEDLCHSIRLQLGEGRLRGIASLQSSEPRKRLRVLVVDDSITVREVQRQMLALRGYDVDVAVDGQDGWHALRDGSYDLLITDVDMPRMNGIELIRTARLEPRFADLPIIIVSYKDREQDRILGLEAGASAYLTKGSFHDDSYVNTVATMIGEPG